MDAEEFHQATGFALPRPLRERRYSLTELAAASGVPRDTLAKAITRGNLAAEKIGTQWVTTLRAVETWQREAKHTPGPRPKRARRHTITPSW
jgi:lambda repressor-like predicted transcriptional regulator